MKKFLFAFLALAMLTGCTDRNDQSLSSDPSESSTAAVEETTISETATAAVTEQKTEADTTEPETESRSDIDVMPIYEQAVSMMYYAGETPFGEDITDPDNPVSDNRFAIFDVDNDGTDELVFYRVNTAMAGLFGVIYGVDDDGELQEEYIGSPLLHFYTNGKITEDFSHNQGFSGDFWPYTLYGYDAESDSYYQIAYVYAWDGEMFPEDYDGNPFPSDADISDTGFVYYICDPKYAYDRENQPQPVDFSKYDEWYKEHLGDSLEFTPTSYTLTEENIAAVFGDGAVG